MASIHELDQTITLQVIDRGETPVEIQMTEAFQELVCKERKIESFRIKEFRNIPVRTVNGIRGGFKVISKKQ